MKIEWKEFYYFYDADRFFGSRTGIPKRGF